VRVGLPPWAPSIRLPANKILDHK